MWTLIAKAEGGCQHGTARDEERAGRRNAHDGSATQGEVGRKSAAAIVHPHRRIMPKLKPLTRCFWMRNPKITTGSVTTVPMAAWGP